MKNSADIVRLNNHRMQHSVTPQARKVYSSNKQKRKKQTSPLDRSPNSGDGTPKYH
jgi:hypothetical protein